MNRSYFALFVALLIHILVIALFWYIMSVIPEFKKPGKENKIKISLKELPKIKKSIAPQTETISIEDIPTINRGKQLKEITKKPSLKFKPKSKPKEPRLNKQPIKKEESQKIKKEQTLPPKEDYIIVEQTKKEIKKTPIDKAKDSMSWLYEDKSYIEEKKGKKSSSSGAMAGKDIKKLYGVDWDKLSPGEQKYILDNKEIMRRITQEVLNRQARVSNIDDINANRVNIIEFYLHPNGDMSDFKFLQKSGYFVLDDITKATIEFAYSKYPRPSEKTLIRYNVFYNLKTH